MTKEELVQWMDSTGKTNGWLAGQCNVKEATVSSWRSTRPVPSKAELIILSLIKAEQEPIVPASFSQCVSVEPSKAEFRAWCQAYKASDDATLDEWMIRELNDAASIWAADLKKAEDQEKENQEPLPPHASELEEGAVPDGNVGDMIMEGIDAVIAKQIADKGRKSSAPLPS